MLGRSGNGRARGEGVCIDRRLRLFAKAHNAYPQGFLCGLWVWRSTSSEICARRLKLMTTDRTTLALAIIIFGVFAIAVLALSTGEADDRNRPFSAPTPLPVTYPHETMNQRPRGPLAVENPARWMENTDYPRRAVQHEASGITHFRLDVSKDGEVDGCDMLSPAVIRTWIAAPAMS